MTGQLLLDTMSLQITALDAVIGALATAFFGGLVAAGAYFLKQLVGSQSEVRALRLSLARLRTVEEAVGSHGTGFAEQALSEEKAQSGVE